MDEQERLVQALWRLYARPARPTPWEGGGNLPWNEPSFSARMLREHLDQSHGAASRTGAEREKQLAWFWEQLALRRGARLLDMTCGPGLYAVALAARGIEVTGVDFGPASIAYARELARKEQVESSCRFIEADVRSFEPETGHYDAALFIYGQLAVFTREEARALLEKVARALRPGGRLCVELLDQERVDKEDSRWWYSDDSGLWGDAPYLSLGERFWYEAEKLSCERFYTIHLETGEMDEILLCDQTYAVEEMRSMLGAAGFENIQHFPAWGSLDLEDAPEWNVYLAEAA